MSQEDKIFLNLAGEFAVASELNRRRVLASVTYGASKSADVFAVSRDMTRVVRIEVKTTQARKWPIGQKATKVTSGSADVFWVFVRLPIPLDGSPSDDAKCGQHAPRFFVVTAEELHTVWRKETEPYLAAYHGRHGKSFDESRGVPNVSLQSVEPYEGQWRKIISRLENASA